MCPVVQKRGVGHRSRRRPRVLAAVRPAKAHVVASGNEDPEPGSPRRHQSQIETKRKKVKQVGWQVKGPFYWQAARQVCQEGQGSAQVRPVRRGSLRRQDGCAIVQRWAGHNPARLTGAASRWSSGRTTSASAGSRRQGTTRDAATAGRGGAATAYPRRRGERICSEDRRRPSPVDKAPVVLCLSRRPTQRQPTKF